MTADDPTAGLPPDLAKMLRDPSILVPQDAAVFALIAEWMDAPSNTASAMTVEEWRDAWVYSTKRFRKAEAERDAALARLAAAETALDDESMKVNDWIERYTNACQHLEQNAASWLKRERDLETLIRRAASFVNAVAVMADDKTPSLAWLADAAVFAADPAAEETGG